MRDFELIELEGVVAHCLARQRLGLLTRESVSAASSLSDDARRELAGPGLGLSCRRGRRGRYPLPARHRRRAAALRAPALTPSSSFFSHADLRPVALDLVRRLERPP